MKNETHALKNAIRLLEVKRAQELESLRDQFAVAYESLKPINLLKSTWKELSSSTDFKNNIVDSVIGIGTGFLSKKLWVGKSHNPIKRLFGTVFQFVITNVVSKHVGDIKGMGENMIQRYLKKRKESKMVHHTNGTDYSPI